MKKSLTREEKFQLVHEYYRSGMNQIDFGKKCGYTYRSIRRWIALFRRTGWTPQEVAASSTLKKIDDSIAELKQLKKFIPVEDAKPKVKKPITWISYLSNDMDPEVNRMMRNWARTNNTSVTQAYEFAAAKLLKLI